MNDLKGKNVTRRNFLGSTAAAAAATMLPISYAFAKSPAMADAKPDSNFGGVQIGTITYSYRSMPGGAENILRYCIESGISSVELMSGDVEEYLGAPKNPMMKFMAAARAAQAPPAASGAPGAPAAPAATAPRPAGPRFTPEQQAEIDKYNTEAKAWRLSVPMVKFEGVRKMFNDAGVDIHIAKFSPGRWSDEETDYAFRAAKALGAKGVSEEISEEACKKMAPYAEKYGLYAIFHQHMQFATPGFSYDTFMAISPAIRFNFDTGHFFGSTGIHPNTIIEKYHDRIFSIHIKDKTGPKAEPANTNQVWGQGEMPLADVLLLLKEKKWPIYADIELEYEVKPWSNAVKEVKTCVNYARQILM